MKWKKIFIWKPLEHVNRLILIPNVFQVILKICKICMLGYSYYPRENVSNCDVCEVEKFWLKVVIKKLPFELCVILLECIIDTYQNMFPSATEVSLCLENSETIFKKYDIKFQRRRNETVDSLKGHQLKAAACNSTYSEASALVFSPSQILSWPSKFPS